MVESEVDDSMAEDEEVELPAPEVNGDDGFGGSVWECVAVTFADYKELLEGMKKSRWADEKAMVKRITNEVLPVLEQRAQAQERKAAKKQRELEALTKLATAKRSSRIAGKMEKQKEVEEAEATERKRLEDLAMAKKEKERRLKMEGVSLFFYSSGCVICDADADDSGSRVSDDDQRAAYQGTRSETDLARGGTRTAGHCLTAGRFGAGTRVGAPPKGRDGAAAARAGRAER